MVHQFPEDAVIDITVCKKPESAMECRHRWIIQVGASLVVVGVAVFGLVTSGKPYEMRDIYLCVASAMIGLWIPSPKLK